LGSIGGQYNTPVAYQSDKLINNELGWKTEWANHSVLFNGAIYQEDWNNAQVAVFDPGLTGELTFNTNGPHRLTIQGSGAWNSGEQTNSPFLTVNANCTATSTPPCGAPILVNNIFGKQGSPPAMSPPLMINARIRYEWAINDFQAFWQIGGTPGPCSSTDRT
jgi:iron complex outermembrane receptor protein